MTAADLRRFRPEFRTKVIADLIGIVFIASLAWMAITIVHADGWDLHTVQLGLTLAAVAAAGAVAVGGAMATQTAGHLHVAWLSVAFGLHAVANGLPALGSGTSNEAPVLIGILNAGNLAVAVLLMLWTTHFPPSGASVHWGFAAVACGAAVLFAAADLHVPAGSVLLELPAIQLAVALGWTGAAIRALATGLGRRDLPVARVGLGLAVLAFGELFRLRAGTGPAEPALLLSGLQLVGTVAVLGGVVGRYRGDLNLLLSEHERQQAALQEAAQHVQQAQAVAAERDHELANGLAGLAGIAHVLGRPTSGPDGVELRSAVLTELTRMHRMLALPGRQGEDGPFDVSSTLSELVVLRRATGMQVDLDASTDLVAARGRDVFVQAATNLLGNCERHAPGSPVRVRAFEAGDRVVVEIRDEGPGVPRGQERAVLERGVTTGATGGSGLGLHVSARLIRERGGDLRVLPPQSHERGFAVRLELPGSDRPRGAGPADLGRAA